MDAGKKVRKVIARSRRGILTKKDNYTLYSAGMYGNRALAWDTLEDLQRSNWNGGVCIRDVRGTKRGNKNSPLPLFDIPYNTLEGVVHSLVSRGISQKYLTFNQSMPNSALTLQGEVTRNDTGRLYITYSRIKKPMRLALLEGEELAEGLVAKMILEEFLWPASLEEINRCLDYFSSEPHLKTPVVEFSTYGVAIGNMPGRNTVIWEVRNY